MSKGAQEARSSTLDLLNEHFNFSEKTLNSMKQFSSLSTGIFFLNKVV